MRVVLLAPLLPQHCSRQGQQVARDDRRDGRTSQLPYIGQVGIGHKRTAKYIISVKTKRLQKSKDQSIRRKKPSPKPRIASPPPKQSTLQSTKNLDPPKLDSRLASRNHLPPKKHFIQIKNGISAAKKKMPSCFLTKKNAQTKKFNSSAVKIAQKSLRQNNIFRPNPKEQTLRPNFLSKKYCFLHGRKTSPQNKKVVHQSIFSSKNKNAYLRKMLPAQNKKFFSQ